MKNFNIKPLDHSMRPEIQNKIDNLTKPKGSLGLLEDLALQVSMIQKTPSPVLRKPHNVLFAADHGIIEEGVSVSPKEVTWQQLAHFSRGGSGINFLCRQHGFELVLVDAGVDYDIPADRGIIDKKIRKSTSNFLYEPAMTTDEFCLCIERGAEVVREVAATGCNVVSFGEMGSGNTSVASIWMHLLTGIPLPDCIGAGAGLDTPGVRHKLNVLSKALANYDGSDDLIEKLAWFGGFELAMATGAMLQAAESGMVILVDGFLMTACMLATAAVNPTVKEYAIYGHQGDESGHRLMLEHLEAKPLLRLGLRLGEGSGAVCAYPILESAVRMINEMDSFEAVKVTKYF